MRIFPIALGAMLFALPAFAQTIAPTTADAIQSAMTPILEAVSTAAVALIGTAVTLLTLWMRTRLQQMTVAAAVATAGGQVIAQVVAGKVPLTDVHASGAAVVTAANAALNAVPSAGSALGQTTATMAAKVAGYVGNQLPALLNTTPVPVAGWTILKT